MKLYLLIYDSYYDVLMKLSCGKPIEEFNIHLDLYCIVTIFTNIFIALIILLS